MNKRDISIEALIEKIKSKEITLPEIQRRYVWTYSGAEESVQH